jgi:hypothetical protein
MAAYAARCSVSTRLCCTYRTAVRKSYNVGWAQSSSTSAPRQFASRLRHCLHTSVTPKKVLRCGPQQRPDYKVHYMLYFYMFCRSQGCVVCKAHQGRRICRRCAPGTPRRRSPSRRCPCVRGARPLPIMRRPVPTDWATISRKQQRAKCMQQVLSAVIAPSTIDHCVRNGTQHTVS